MSLLLVAALVLVVYLLATSIFLPKIAVAALLNTQIVLSDLPVVSFINQQQNVYGLQRGRDLGSRV